MSYALLRNKQWVSAPKGYDPRLILPPVLALCDSPKQAWLSSSLDLALERCDLLRMCWGWNTEIRVLK